MFRRLLRSILTMDEERAMALAIIASVAVFSVLVWSGHIRQPAQGSDFRPHILN
jgi:hypothetical protein